MMWMMLSGLRSTTDCCAQAVAASAGAMAAACRMALFMLWRFQVSDFTKIRKITRPDNTRAKNSGAWGIWVRAAACGGSPDEQMRIAGIRCGRLRSAQSAGLHFSVFGMLFADGGGRNERKASCSPPQWGGGELHGSDELQYAASCHRMKFIFGGCGGGRFSASRRR